MKDDTLVMLLLFGSVALVGGFFAVKTFKDRQDFYNQLLPYALQLEKETGIQTDITLTQAAHETGFGTSGNTDLVLKYHNLFGIKPGSTWTGPVATFTTHETINGKYLAVQDQFRSYPDFLSSMRDWAQLLIRLYPDAYRAAQAGDINAFAYGLQHGKAGAYATDPKYSVALLDVYSVVEGLA